MFGAVQLNCTRELKSQSYWLNSECEPPQTRLRTHLATHTTAHWFGRRILIDIQFSLRALIFIPTLDFLCTLRRLPYIQHNGTNLHNCTLTDERQMSAEQRKNIIEKSLDQNGIIIIIATFTSLNSQFIQLQSFAHLPRLIRQHCTFYSLVIIRFRHFSVAYVLYSMRT